MSDTVKKYRFILTPRILILVIAGIFVTCVSGTYFFRHVLAPNSGLISMFPEISIKNDTVVFAPKDPVSIPIVKNLVPQSDAIVSVNGKEIRTVRDFVEAVNAIRTYKPFPVEVLRNGTESLTVELTPEPNILRIDWIFTLLFALVCSLIGFFLVIRFGNDLSYNLAAFTAFLYTLYICVKPFYFESPVSYGLVQIGSASPWLIALFAIYFPDKKGNHILRISLVVFFTTLLSVFTVSKTVLFGIWYAEGSDLLYSILFNTELVNQVAQTLELFVFCFLCVYSYLKSHLYYEKRQLEWMVAGLIVAFTPFFFFEKLPFILRTYMGETMSLGGFSNIFLALFPLFFFIGAATNKTLNIKVSFNRLVISVFLVLVLSLLYLLAMNPLIDYFAVYYGFSAVKGCFVISFFFVLIVLALNFALDKVRERFTERNSVQTAYAMESQYKKLLAEYEALCATRKLDIQTEKLWDLHAFFAGMRERVSGEGEKLKSAVLVFEKLFKRLFVLISANPHLVEKELKADKELAYDSLNLSKDALIRITDSFKTLDSILGLKPGVKSWIAPRYIVKSTIASVEKKYPDAEIEAVVDSDHKVFCVHAEVVHALREIIYNAIESQSHDFSRVVVRVKSMERATVFEISDSGKGVPESHISKLGEPFYTTKQGHNGLGLYAARTYIEKNEGNIGFSRSEGMIVTVTFADERNHK